MAAGVDPLRKDATVLKRPKGVSPNELVTLPFKFNCAGYDAPSAAWKNEVENAVKEICSTYLTTESDRVFVAFEGRDKKRLNKIFDLFGVDYEDYEKREKKAKSEPTGADLKAVPGTSKGVPKRRSSKRGGGIQIPGTIGHVAKPQETSSGGKFSKLRAKGKKRLIRLSKETVRG